MNTDNFPEIDDVLGDILTDGHAPANSPKKVETGTSPAVAQTSSEGLLPPEPQMSDSAMLLAEHIRKLHITCHDSSLFKVRIYSEIMTTLQSCDFGTTSMAKIVNAILLDFIERNSEILRRNRRRSIID